MKQALYLFILLVISGNLFARETDSRTLSIPSGQKRDSVTSLKGVKVSYTLSNKNLVNLAEKILYKKTPQEDMYLYLLRPDTKSRKPLPAIVYFTGGAWLRGTVESQIANPAWFRDHGIPRLFSCLLLFLVFGLRDTITWPVALLLILFCMGYVAWSLVVAKRQPELVRRSDPLPIETLAVGMTRRDRWWVAGFLLAEMRD